MKPTPSGFTLIEMLITVVIVSILAGMAIPSYTRYIERGNRSEGSALLSEAAAKQEQYFSQNNSYITLAIDLAKLKLRTYPGGVTSPTGKYTLQVSSVANDGGYTLTAIPTFTDIDCRNLTLDAIGNKGRTGTGLTIAECWR